MHIKEYVDGLKATGIRKGDFAKLAGITSGHLSQILGGKLPGLSMVTMRAIVRASDGAIKEVEDFYVEDNGK